MSARPCIAVAAYVLILGAPARSRAVPQDAPKGVTRADTVVRDAGRPHHGGVATLVEELSIGGSAGASDEYLFGDVADIAVGRDGSVYVFDRQVPALRVYDSSGKYVRTIGRRGQGPGEYRSVSGIAFARDGRLLLWDTGNWRINVYSPAGDVLTHWSTPSGSGGSATASYSRALLVDTAGSLYARRTIFAGGDVRARSTVWIRYHPDGSVRDTLSAPAIPWVPRRLEATTPDGHGITTAEVPFDPRPIVTFSPLGYFVTGLPNRYAFEVHRPSSPVLSIRRGVRPEQVTAGERSDARRRTEESMRRIDPNWRWNGPEIPRTKPFYDDIQIGIDGRIWVATDGEIAPRIGNISSGMGSGRGGPPSASRPRESSRPPRPARYDVFEPGGTFIGTVEIPPRVSTAVRNGDHIWAVAYDDDDVASVKRYRIVWR